MTTELSVTCIPFIGTEQIERAIAAVKVRGEELDQAIQLTGISILNHIELHGDVTVFQKLFEAMPKGSRRNALVEWATVFGKVAVNDDRKTAKVKPFLFAKGAKTDLAGATAEPWFTFKVEKAPVDEFNLIAALANVRKQLLAAQKKGQTVVGADMLGDFEALSVKVAAAQKPVAEAVQ